MSPVRLDLLPLALLLVAGLGAGLWLWVRRRRRVAALLGDRGLLDRVSGIDLYALPTRRLALVLLAGLLVAAALLDPRWGAASGAPHGPARDVVLVLDASNSMLVEDVAPNRLERQRSIAHRIVRQLEGDRLGVVAFGGEAVVLSPPTPDRSSAEMYVTTVGPGVVRQTGSALGAGLRQAAALLAAGPQWPGGRIAILISDGEPMETETRDDVMDAARRTLGVGAVIHTIAVGTARGGPVPDLDPGTGARRGYKREPDTGEIAISQRHDELLREVSRASDGHFVDASDARSVDRFLVALGEAPGAGSPLGAGGQSGARYAWFIGLALLLLGLDSAAEVRAERARGRRR